MINKPRIESCGNHWCVETFDESRFFSRCYRTWQQALKIALQLVKDGRLPLLLALSLTMHALGAAQVTGFTLPDPKLTPGETRNLDLQTICSTRWGLDHRFVTEEMKQQTCKAYGITENCDGKHYEQDHLIPRSSGGADSVLNLWPQPLAEAHLKDRAEVWAEKGTCAGRLQLSYVQKQFADDWTVLYRLYLASRPVPRTTPRTTPPPAAPTIRGEIENAER